MFLRRGQQVPQTHGDKCPQRNPEWQRRNIQVIIAASRRMQVDPVVPHTHRIHIRFRALAAGGRHLVLHNRPPRSNPPRFPNVRRHREPVRRTKRIAAQPQPRPPCSAVCARRSVLHPIEHAQAHLPRLRQEPRAILRRCRREFAIERPIHQAPRKPWIARRAVRTGNGSSASSADSA